MIEEGCLSIPGLRADLERPEKIYLEYQDLDLNVKNLELGGLLARVTQHEIDHLHGVLFIDHLSKEMKKKVKEHLNQIKKGGIQTSYVLAEIPSKAKKLAKNHILDRI